MEVKGIEKYRVRPEFLEFGRPSGFGLPPKLPSAPVDIEGVEGNRLLFSVAAVMATSLMGLRVSGCIRNQSRQYTVMAANRGRGEHCSSPRRAAPARSGERGAPLRRAAPSFHARQVPADANVHSEAEADVIANVARDAESLEPHTASLLAAGMSAGSAWTRCHCSGWASNSLMRLPVARTVASRLGLM